MTSGEGSTTGETLSGLTGVNFYLKPPIRATVMCALTSDEKGTVDALSLKLILSFRIPSLGAMVGIVDTVSPDRVHADGYPARRSLELRYLARGNEVTQ